MEYKYIYILHKGDDDDDSDNNVAVVTVDIIDKFIEFIFSSVIFHTVVAKCHACKCNNIVGYYSIHIFIPRC